MPPDRRAARLRGLQWREGFDLRRDVGRAVEQKPTLAIGADGEARLRAPGRAARARGGAVGARAVPLRHAAAGGRAENAYDHARRGTGSILLGAFAQCHDDVMVRAERTGRIGDARIAGEQKTLGSGNRPNRARGVRRSGMVRASSPCRGSARRPPNSARSRQACDCGRCRTAARESRLPPDTAERSRWALPS